jgi:hypothetical protein
VAAVGGQRRDQEPAAGGLGARSDQSEPGRGPHLQQRMIQVRCHRHRRWSGVVQPGVGFARRLGLVPLLLGVVGGVGVVGVRRRGGAAQAVTDVGDHRRQRGQVGVVEAQLR